MICQRWAGQAVSGFACLSTWTCICHCAWGGTAMEHLPAASIRCSSQLHSSCTQQCHPLPHRLSQLLLLARSPAHHVMACCRYTILSHLAMKLERDLWGLLDGPWDGPDAVAFRRSWAEQVRPLCKPLVSVVVN